VHILLQDAANKFRNAADEIDSRLFETMWQLDESRQMTSTVDAAQALQQ
jgi:hypothetical protein